MKVIATYIIGPGYAAYPFRWLLAQETMPTMAEAATIIQKLFPQATVLGLKEVAGSVTAPVVAEKVFLEAQTKVTLKESQGGMWLEQPYFFPKGTVGTIIQVHDDLNMYSVRFERPNDVFVVIELPIDKVEKDLTSVKPMS